MTKNKSSEQTSSSSQDSEPADDSRRVIKKYPNRRLYDTSSSSYITLHDIKQLVMDRTAFVIVDVKTGDDLTRSILLQIILEEEAGGVPMFTEPVLSNIIRFYGHAMQGVMGSYLEKMFQSFMDVQIKMAEQSKGIKPEMWEPPLMQNMMSNFAQMQEQMLSAFGLKPKK